MQVQTEDVPHVADEATPRNPELGKGFYTIPIRYGFMDEPNILRALAQCRVGGSRFKPDGDLFHHRARKAAAAVASAYKDCGGGVTHSSS